MNKLLFLLILIGVPLVALPQLTPRPLVSVELEWEAVEGAKGYEIQIQAPDFDKKFVSKTPLFQIQIPLGINQARGRSFDFRGVYGEWSEFSELDAQPQKVDLKASHAMYSPVIKLTGYKGWVQIKWKEVPGAKGYRFYLLDEAGKQLAKQETVGALTAFRIRPGKYSYNVTALYTGGIESAQSELQPAFEISGKKLPPPSLVSSAAEHQLRKYQLKAADPSLKLVAQVSYSAYLGDEWEVLGEEKFHGSFQAKKYNHPGRYRLAFRTQLKGFADSDPIYQEYHIKPTPEVLGELNK